MYARQLDLPIQTHLAETAHEIAQSRERYGETPLARLHGLGATGPGFIAIHGVHLAADDIELLALHGGHVVHCPASNMKLGSGIAPVGRAAAAGASTSRSAPTARRRTTGSTSSGEMRLAALLAKVATGDAAALPAAQIARERDAWRRARARSRSRDRLARRRQAADVVAVDLSGLDAVPCYDPVSHLVHAIGREAVTDVWVGAAAWSRAAAL